MIVFPNAKINIGLHVVSKRPDGYHNLETLFYPVKLADALEMAEGEPTGLTVSGIAIDGDTNNNLIVKAYRLLEKDFHLPPVRFYLHKVIPFGAGLGGGSSDAAFTLKMLNDYFDLGISSAGLAGYARQIGADCPFFIHNTPAFATGIGDQLSPIEIGLQGFEILIVKPPFEVSTPEAYRNIVPARSSFDLREIGNIPVEQWKDFVTNDFEKTVFPKYPEIEHLKTILYQMGAVYAAMSGSGSAVFGLFRHLPVSPANFLPEGIFIYR